MSGLIFIDSGADKVIFCSIISTIVLPLTFPLLAITLTVPADNAVNKPLVSLIIPLPDLFITDHITFPSVALYGICIALKVIFSVTLIFGVLGVILTDSSAG